MRLNHYKMMAIFFLLLLTPKCTTSGSSPTIPAQIPTTIEYAAGQAIVVGSSEGLSGSLNSLPNKDATEDTTPNAVYAIDVDGTAVSATISGNYFYFPLTVGRLYAIGFLSDTSNVAHLEIDVANRRLQSLPMIYVDGSAASGSEDFTGRTPSTTGSVNVIDLGEITYSTSGGITFATGSEDITEDIDVSSDHMIGDGWMSVWSNIDTDGNGTPDADEGQYNTFKVSYSNESNQLPSEIYASDGYSDPDHVESAGFTFTFTTNRADYAAAGAEDVYLWADSEIALTNGNSYAAEERIAAYQKDSTDEGNTGFDFLDAQSNNILGDGFPPSTNYYFQAGEDITTLLTYKNVRGRSEDGAENDLKSNAVVSIKFTRDEIDNTKVAGIEWKFVRWVASMEIWQDMTEREVKEQLAVFNDGSDYYRSIFAVHDLSDNEIDTDVGSGGFITTDELTNGTILFMESIDISTIKNITFGYTDKSLVGHTFSW